MRNTHAGAVTLAIALAASAGAQAPRVQPPRTCAGGTNSRALAMRLDSIARKTNFMGVVLIDRRGKRRLACAYGSADAAWSVPNTLDSRFNIASLTKQFTGMAVLQLAAAGQLSLDDTLPKFYPASPPAWRHVTVRELLSHTSGIPGPGLADFKRGITSPYTPRELVEIFAQKQLDFVPGTKWKYSNSGYYILGYIIERASGESYAQFLDAHIFRPLRMFASGYESNTTVLPHHAFGYVADTTDRLTGLRYADYLDWSLPYAAGGLFSTAGDLLQWNLALLSRDTSRLGVSKRTLDSVFTPPPATGAGIGSDYRAGWFVTVDAGRTSIWHEGSDPGYSAYELIHPDDGTIIIVLSNVDAAPVRETARALDRAMGPPR
jgi:Beta-lactamase class C and other penicillin binding proteins